MTGRRVYIATAYDAMDRAREAMQLMLTAGWRVTYDWMQPLDDTLSMIAIKEVRAVIEADVLVVLLPGGRGTHTEMGVALGVGTPVVLVGGAPDAPAGDRPPTYEHPLVIRVPSMSDIVAACEREVAA